MILTSYLSSSSASVCTMKILAVIRGIVLGRTTSCAVPVSAPPNADINISFNTLGSLGSSYKNGVGRDINFLATARVMSVHTSLGVAHAAMANFPAFDLPLLHWPNAMGNGNP